MSYEFTPHRFFAGSAAEHRGDRVTEPAAQVLQPAASAAHTTRATAAGAGYTAAAA